jgi:AraC-like DNA-binding protein
MFLMNLISIAEIFLLLLFSGHLLLTNNGNAYLNKLLAFLSLSRGLQFLNLWLSQNNELPMAPYLYKIPYPFLYITPAVFYLYIRGFLNDQTSLKKRDLLHFLPVFIGLADMTPWLTSTAEDKQRLYEAVSTHQAFFFQDVSDLITPGLSRMIRVVLFLFYITLSWKLVIGKGILRNMNVNPIGNNWILLILTLSTAGHLFLFISIGWDNLHPGHTQDGLLASLHFAILSHLFLILYIFYRPRILYGYVLVSHDFFLSHLRRTSPVPMEVAGDTIDSTGQSWSMENAGSATERKESLSKSEKPSQLQSSPESIGQWKEEILRHMDEVKPYLDPSFRLHNLSAKTDIPQHHCSYVINHVLGKNFNDWINEYRVAHFISTYEENAGILTQEALAKASGFGSRRTLHNAFMKIHGIPPGIFLQQIAAGYTNS